MNFLCVSISATWSWELFMHDGCIPAVLAIGDGDGDSDQCHYEVIYASLYV